jgi:cobaltochelatase CobN
MTRSSAIVRSFALLLLLLAAYPAAAKPVRLAFLFSDGNITSTLRAYKALIEERPDLEGQVTLSFLTESMFDEVKPAELSSADVLVMDVMNQQLLDRYNKTHTVDLIAAIRARGKVIAVGEGLLPKETYTNQGAIWDDHARALWGHSGFANQIGLLKYALDKAGVAGLTVPDAQPSLDFGYYYPDGKTGQVFSSWEAFDAWREAHGKVRAGAPRIAVSFFKSTFYGGETEVLDAIIAGIERQGANAIPMFGYPGAVAHQRLLLDPQGLARADAAMGFLFNFSDTDAWKLLSKVDIPVVHLVSLYGRSEKEWRESASGMTQFEGTFQVAVPELAGTIAPTVIASKEKVRDQATGVTMVVNHPIASRIATAVQRTINYAKLRKTANHDKRVALIYYDYPPGKANIGASYLNVAESLSNILERLAAEGYDVGLSDRSADKVLADITTRARNVGGYAPGELDEMLNQGGAVRVSVAEYRQWLNDLAPGLRARILKDWGAPESSRLMTAPGSSGPSIIVPLVRYGNIVLMPQPARGWGEDADKMYHAKDLAPHHQYTAAYAWLRHGFKADAVVHIGTHGTLEWLDGKDIGLSEEDAPDALIADVPDLYIYNVDVVGEGLVARRRGMAALIDHMVPPFKKGGLYPELAALSELISDFDKNESKNLELANAYRSRIREQVVSLGIARDLGLDLSAADAPDEATLHRIENHLLELKSQNIPYGLHAFGRTPEKSLRESTIDAVVSADRSLLPNKAKVLADEIENRIVASGPRELDSLVRAYQQALIVPAASVVRAPRNLDFPAASTVLMNALTARLGLDAMALTRAQTIAVTGSAGALGGYIIQLARADGLRVIADVSDAPEDRELVKRLGGDELVTRGPGFTDRVRALVPNGVDGLFDAALLNDAAVPAIADGGLLVTVRGWNGHVDRGVRVFPVFVGTAIADTPKLERLRDQAEAGVLTPRVARVFPASEAAEAHRLLEKGGIRGRLVLDFTQL